MMEKESKSYGKYIDEISKNQTLSVEEEKDLSEQIMRGNNRAADKLAMANLKFVISLARNYRGCGLDMDDLISEGNIGLIKAVGKFDASHGRFVSYAAPFIRKSIKQAIERQGGIYRVPKEEATMEEKRRSRPISVDAPLGGRENVNLLTMLVNPEAPDADSVFNWNAQDSMVRVALNVLDERERMVVSEFYGIGSDHRTLAEIAVEMNLKRERVRQIRDKAVRKISKQLKNND